MIKINRFQRILLYFLIVFLLCVSIGTISLMATQTVGKTIDANVSLLLSLAISLVIILSIRKIWICIDSISEKWCYSVSAGAFACILILLFAFRASARVNLYVDSFDDFDTAIYLQSHSEVTEDLVHIRYIGSFGNNYTLILFEKLLVRIMLLAGIQKCLSAFSLLNIFVLLSSVILTWLIVKETQGLKPAAKTAVLCMLNPIFI